MTSTCSLFTPGGEQRNPLGACDLRLWEHIWNLRMVSELREGTSHTARLNCRHCEAPWSQKLHQPPAPEASELEGRWNWTPLVQGLCIYSSRTAVEFEEASDDTEVLFLNGRIIALQCGVNLCPTTPVSDNDTCVPSWASLPTLIPPLSVITETRAGVPVLHSSFPLVLFCTLWVNKDLVHKYNRILLSHKKEQIWVSCSAVDEPRACYTEGSKSEREQQILP